MMNNIFTSVHISLYPKGAKFDSGSASSKVSCDSSWSIKDVKRLFNSVDGIKVDKEVYEWKQDKDKEKFYSYTLADNEKIIFEINDNFDHLRTLSTFGDSVAKGDLSWWNRVSRIDDPKRWDLLNKMIREGK